MVSAVEPAVAMLAAAATAGVEAEAVLEKAEEVKVDRVVAADVDGAW